MEDEAVVGRITNVRENEEDRKNSCGEEATKRDELKRKSSVSTDLWLATGVSRNETGIEDNDTDKCDSEILGDRSSCKSTVYTNSTTNVTFKGFKKRILSQTRDNQISSPRSNNRLSAKKSRERKVTASTISETKRGKITEYAQYLGLQPASNRANCTSCQGTTNTYDPSMLNQHRCTCPSDIMTQSTGLSSPGTSDSCTGTSNPTTTIPSSANNFRITRKVYLCAACGTYFENWNLFLHMRETHKRHICLFCLGMFGQAERLSYHLTKKHNVPETTFTSVEDFYNVFKGSCYLICCTCEKVFAETDNFYNHFCSPVQKGRSKIASETCSLCHQSVNNHSSLCSNSTEIRDATQANIGLPGIPGVPNKITDSKTSVRSRNKRILKNNRIKRNESSPLTSYQKKMAALYARKTNTDTGEQSGGSSTETIVKDSLITENFETATTTTMTTSVTTATTTILTKTTEVISESPAPKPAEMDLSNSIRDTVSETIMEVSKCTDDKRLRELPQEPCGDVGIVEVNSSALKISSSPSLSSSSLPSPLRQRIDTPSCYDSVTETIMEVSRCYNDNEMESSDECEDREYDNNRFMRIETSSRDSDADALIMDDGGGLTDHEKELPSLEERYDDRLKNSLNYVGKIVRRRKRRRTTTSRRNELSQESEEASSSCDSEAESSARDELTKEPINTTRTGQNDETECILSESCSSPEKESQTTSSVSFTTVNTTDRSLVIKICTNRNAQFSVTKNSANSNHDNHDTSRESEENNNGEDSASESKTSNHSEHGDRESMNSCHEEEEEDDEQSETNSLKLSVENEKRIEEEPTTEKENLSIVDETKEEIKINEDDTTKNEAEENITEAKESNDDAEEKIESKENVTAEENIETSTIEGNKDGIILASDDVPSIDLNVDGLLETMKIEDLLKRCISAASSFCVYCNHARHIAVNGKQLALHVLAEHRFLPQHPAIIIQREQLIVVLKKSLDEVEAKFFNLDSYDDVNGTYNIVTPRIFECFHCRYHSLVHKEIYLHNRKMHQKTILICIMCKSTFYSYSELLCHLCPGVYSPNVNVTYRCCLCPVSNLPSAFRLMVHLRKRHHSCDVCLESTGNQQRLSNHVWKHKLHHLCYRCGIAYRNKPDITKHLFWKHGTESVLCKKCLQKKWPHVYHFCIPPTAFVCEECTSSFTRAVALKVHKRLHSNDRPYGCGECEERFISKKLAAKHEARHREPEVPPIDIVTKEEEGEVTRKEEDKASMDKCTVENVGNAEASPIPTSTSASAASLQITATKENVVDPPPCEVKEVKEPVKKVVDVYDLPPLNLSSDSDSDVDETTAPDPTAKDRGTAISATDEGNNCAAKVDDEIETKKLSPTRDLNDSTIDVELDEDEKKEDAQIMDGIWDNFKSYAASLGQHDSSAIDIASEEKKMSDVDREYLCKIILADHDYCVVYPDKSLDEDETKEKEDTAKDEDSTIEGEHDYGNKVTKSSSNTSILLDSDTNNGAATNKRKRDKTPKTKSGNTSSSDSSTDSDSSSCSCGTNCSCSSSSSGSSSSSSSSSDSDSSASEASPTKKQQNTRRERKREKEKETPSTEASKNNSTAKDELPVTEKIEAEKAAVESEIKNEEIAESNIEINDRPASPQLIFRESDLDTDETETDEDFYDEHPQQLANKLLAEKRNQLMLLAAVAPPSTEIPTLPAKPDSLNNGTIEATIVNSNSLETSANVNVVDEANCRTATTTRKRVKTKKRKKSDRGKPSKIVPATPTVESIKLNIPKSFYDKKTKKFGAKGSSLITVVPSRSSTPLMTNSIAPHSEIAQNFFNDTIKTPGMISLGGSGSENDNKRSSKRKRVPKRFYGDSSDDEVQQQQPDHHHHHHHHNHNHIQAQQQQQQNYNQPSLKWRKVEQPTVPSLTIKAPILPPSPSTVTPSANANYPTKNVTIRLSGFDRPMERTIPIVTGPSEFDEPAESSTAESSDNDDTNVRLPQPIEPQQQLQLQQQQQQQQQPAQPQPSIKPEIPVVQPLIVPNTIHNIATSSTSGPERSVNLYCYCQCPYDEVSEMIACDGSDCKIEWFHFECVGIMVPPKGKWYCPDCRRKDSSLVNDDYLE